MHPPTAMSTHNDGEGVEKYTTSLHIYRWWWWKLEILLPYYAAMRYIWLICFVRIYSVLFVFLFVITINTEKTEATTGRSRDCCGICLSSTAVPVLYAKTYSISYLYGIL